MRSKGLGDVGKKTSRSEATARRTSENGKLRRVAPAVPPKTMTAAVPWTMEPADPPSRTFPPTIATTPRRIPMMLARSIVSSPLLARVPDDLPLAHQGILDDLLPKIVAEVVKLQRDLVFPSAQVVDPDDAPVD